MFTRVALPALLVLFVGALSLAYAADDQPPETLALEVLFERPDAGGRGDLIVMPNGDLLAVAIFASSFTRFDPSGRVLWERSHSGGEPRHTVAVPGGGFVSVGVKKGSPVSVFPPGVAIKGNFNIWVGRFDDGGALLWEKTFGDLQLEMGQSVAAFEDGGIAIAGAIRNRRIWLIKLAPHGRLRGEIRLPGGKSAILALADGELVVVSQVPEYQEMGCGPAFDITPVKIWWFDDFGRFGRLRNVVTARDNVIGSSTGCNWNFRLLADPTNSEAVFLLSSMRGHRRRADAEVTKVDLARGRVWS